MKQVSVQNWWQKGRTITTLLWLITFLYMQKPIKTSSKYHNIFSMGKKEKQRKKERKKEKKEKKGGNYVTKPKRYFFTQKKCVFHKVRQLSRLLTSNDLSPWCYPWQTNRKWQSHHDNVHYGHIVPTFSWTQNFTGTKPSLLTRYGWFTINFFPYTLKATSLIIGK